MDASPEPIVQPEIHLLARMDAPAEPALPWQTFPRDWHGTPLADSVGAGFRLATDGRWLRFEARCLLHPGPPLPGAAPGAFTPQLWTRDVAELFLGEAETSRYTEWNLSPQGAWWAQSFLARRSPEPGYTPPALVRTWTTPHPSGSRGWQAGLMFPLPTGFPLSRLRLNVTMILGEAPRRHLATIALAGSPPDFHLVESFPAPVIKQAAPPG